MGCHQVIYKLDFMSLNRRKDFIMSILLSCQNDSCNLGGSPYLIKSNRQVVHPHLDADGDLANQLERFKSLGVDGHASVGT